MAESNNIIPQASSVTSPTGVIVPLYFSPDGTWDAVAQAKTAHPSVPIVAIINPNNGTGSSKDPGIASGVQNLQSAGVLVIGYVATLNGTVNSTTVTAAIDTYKSWYNVSGVFLDEMSNTAGSETYYSNINNYAKSQGLTLTVGNPGQETVSSYIGTVDNIVIYEDQGMPSNATLATNTFNGAFPKSNFSYVAFGVSPIPSNATILGTTAYVGYMYITDDNLPNPYNTLSSHFGNLVAALDTTPPPPPPQTVPSAPQNLQATPGNAQVSISWQVPSSNGGSPITNYNVYRGTSSGSETLLTQIGNLTSYTDGTATNGQTYYYKVSAVNSAGESTQSNEASATPTPPPPPPQTVPSAPQNLQATPGNAKVTLNWQAPSSNGGSAITYYKIYKSTSSGTEIYLTKRGNVTSYTDLAVTNGITYFYKVSALNSIGESPQSNETSATPLLVPTAPQNLQATPGNAKVTLNWQAPSSNGGSAITNYKIYRSTSSGTETLLTTRGNVTSYTDLTVTNGLTYFYKVSALNSVGESPQSNEAIATLPAVPTAPQNLQATPGVAKILLNWQAPSSNGGSAITNYKIYRSTSTGTETLLITRGNVTSYTDTGLANGVTYFYKVSAVNSIGESPQSNEASTTTPLLVPTAPQNLQATPGNAKVTLNWQAPSSNGGSAITNYKIYRSNSTGTETLLTTRGNVTSYTDLTVTNGLTYFYKVSALNSVGESPQSNEAKATLSTPPSAPQNLQATPGNAQISLSWQVPSSNGGSAITNYKIYRSTSTGTETLLTTRGNLTSYTDTTVTNGVTYFYKVSALNSIGESPQSNEISATPLLVPTAPQNLQATPGNAKVTLNWQAPSSNGGSAITNYKIYRSNSTGTETLLTTRGNLTSYTDLALTNGLTYFYKVSAVNSVGESLQSNEANATLSTPPSAPQNLQATPGNAKVTLNWQAPSSNGGSAITGYKIYRSNSTGTETLLATRGNLTSYTDLAVTNGLTYFYKVSALNSIGESPQSNEAKATLSTPPSAPQNLQATPGNAKVTLNWQTPSSNGGSAITGYKIYRSNSTGTETLLATRGNLTSYTDTGLTNGLTYFYKVSALNSIGESPQSNEASATVPTIPSAPQNLQATGGNAKVTLNWQAPSSNGGSAVTGYKIYRSNSTGTETLLTTRGNLTSYTDLAVTNGLTYFYKVSAINSIGESLKSNEASVALSASPSAPQNLQTTSGDARVTLNWQAPSSNGGSPITSYKIYRSTSSGTETLLATRGNVTSYTDTTVTNGLTYFYKVSALNSIGESPQSNEASAAPSAVLSAPQNLHATSGNTQVSLRWQAPASGGSAITGYKIYRSNSTGTETLLTTIGNLTSYTDTGLTNGLTYFYKVTAVILVAESPQSNEANAIPATTPSAPQNLQAIARSGNATLTWQAPSSNGGSAITGYKIYKSNSTGTETYLTTRGNLTKYTDLTVTNGHIYFYQVSAINSAGESSRSAEVSVTPPLIPSAPLNLQAIGGNARVTLNWQAPSSNGGSAVTGYKIYRSNSTGTETLLATRGNLTSYTDLAVTNGLTYFYKVSAINLAGESSKSNEASVTLSTVPSAPQNLQATAGSAKVTLNWQAPSSNGGSSITGYKIYKSTSTGTETYLTTRGNVTSYADLAVTNGITYFYKVSAINSIGESPQSKEASATAPTNLVAIGGNGQIALSWNAASSYGGLPVANYKIYRSNATGSETLLTTIGNVTSYTNTGLANGLTYFYKVSAQNSVGESPKSNEASATTLAVPSAPQNLQATGGIGNVTLSWQAPSGNGGSAITGYNIYRSTSSGTETLLATRGNLTSYTDLAVTNGLTYFYKVSSLNNIGESPKSNEASATTLVMPSAPQNLQATGGVVNVTLSWQTPSSNGGSAITNYKIYRSTSSGTETLLTTIGNVTSYADTGLTNGVTYFYKVSASNSIGESSKSSEASATAPTNLVATAGNGRVALSWHTASNYGGSPVTNYKIYKSTSSGTETYLTTRGNVASYTDLAVTNGLTYFYKVSALNSIGESPKSNEANATLSALPSAPQNLQATGGNAKVTLSWQVPSSNGGSAITSYKIYKSNSTGTETLLATRGNLTSYTDLTVTNGHTYFYKVSALNSIGESPQSNEASVALSAATSAPQNLQATGGNAKVTLNWQVPSSNGGSAITSYKIYKSNSTGTETLLTTRGNLTSYTDLTVTNGHTYFYKVSALNSIGESPQSNEANATLSAAPTAPQNLQAIGGNAKVTLSWQVPSSNGGSAITSYKIYKSTSSGTETYLTTRGNVTSYTDLAVTNGITYFYKVSALNSIGESVLSDESSTVQASSPTGLTASVISPSQINLRWTAPTNTGGSSVIGYQIQRNGTVFVNNTASTQTLFNNTGLLGNHQQTYRVAAWNSAALGHFSTSASAVTNLSITTIYKIDSGLVASDSLRTGNMSNWVFYGTAVQQNAPHSASEDANGMHIGLLATPTSGFIGYFAISPLTTAHLFHAKVILPVARPTISSAAVDDFLYVQQEMYQNPHIDAIGCGATLFSDRTEWKAVWQQGNDKDVTFEKDVYDNRSASQPTSRDCTLVTNGINQFTQYIDGQTVFSNSSISLNMPQPFQSYLELQTNSQTPPTGNNYTGTFTDYYATTSGSIMVINAGAGSIVKVVNATSGGTLASSTAFSNGTAFVDVGRYNMPINANVVVYDTTGTNILASTSAPAGIYGGDVFNVGDSTVPQTTITVNSFDTTLGRSISGIYTTIARGQTNVATGFTPISYAGDRDTEYTIIPQDFQTHLFDHWNDGSQYRAKIIDPTTANVNLTAYYIEGHATATSIAPGESTVPPGSHVTFTATVADQSGSSPTTPVGNLTFDDAGAGGSFSSSVCTINGTGSCTTTYTILNKTFSFPLTITGTYSPSSSDTTHKGSSGSATITVGTPPPLHPTSITITPNPARVNEGDQITFTAQVRDQSGSPSTPAGNVTFTDSSAGGSFDPSTCNLNGTGSCTAIYRGPDPAPAFTVVITGTYSPSDTTHQGSTGTSRLTVTAPNSSTLTVATQDSVGNAITGYFISLTQGGRTVATGFSPATFTLNNTLQYSVSESSFNPYFFDHWLDNDLTDTPRLVSISTDTQITGVYRNTAISLSPSTGPTGTTVTVSGNTFNANSPITITFNGTAVSTTPTTVTTNSSGGFSGATFTVPSSAAAGSNIVQLSDGSHRYSAWFIVGPSAAITLYQTSGNNGDAVKVTGAHFSPNSKISIYFDTILLSDVRAGNPAGDPSVNPGILLTNSTGGFIADIQIPYATAGAHNVRVTDQSNSDTKGYTATPGALLLNPLTGHTGTIVNFHASGFAANSTMRITLGGTPVTTIPAAITTSSEGGAPGSFTIPSNATIGTHPIQISDASGNAYSSSFNVTGSSTPVFTTQNIITGLGTLTSATDGMAFIPDNGPGVDGSGAFMVIEKNGTVVVVKNTGGAFVKQSPSFVNVPVAQGYANDVGLLGIAFDPNWQTTKMVYFYKTVNIGGVLQNQVVRYTAMNDSSGNLVANTTSGEQLIIGGWLAGTDHNAGHIKFDSHGNLFITTGDNFLYYPGQDLTDLRGKMLRITPLASPGSNGLLYSIPSTNPFVTNPDPTVRKEIYSYGLRNPWTFDIDSQTGKIYINMVGHNTWESIFDSTNPANFGWSNYEGPTVGNPENLANYKEPTYWYPHGGIEPTTGFVTGLEAITGGAFYHCSANCYPSQLQGAYFFGDYAIGYIVALLPTDVNPPQTDPGTGVPKGQVQTVMSGLSLAPIDMSVWHGKLYYVTLTGSVGVLNYN